MNVIVVVGSDLTVNSSANLCHLSYIQGLLENGCNVDLITVGKDITSKQIGLGKYKDLNIYSYNREALYTKISNLVKKKNSVVSSDQKNEVNNNVGSNENKSLFGKIKAKLISLYGPYELSLPWAKKAVQFKSNKVYDLAISLAFPPVSHFLTYELIKIKNIMTKRWIQIWEDPWCQDLLFKSRRTKKDFYKAKAEEKRLLELADEVLYVSPITLANQQKLFLRAADKMRWEPVPTYYVNKNMPETRNENVFGYFGDYFSAIRNLAPFYEAAKELNANVDICGCSDIMFESTENIKVRGRVSLEELKPIEDQTSVLVFLCNLNGGQIPGKIYQYSATYKTILFILDGKEEKKFIKDYFSQFNRYVFCENNVKDIVRAMRSIESGDLDGVENKCLDNFSPKKIVEKIINGTNR